MAQFNVVLSPENVPKFLRHSCSGEYTHLC